MQCVWDWGPARLREGPTELELALASTAGRSHVEHKQLRRTIGFLAGLQRPSLGQHVLYERYLCRGQINHVSRPSETLAIPRLRVRYA